MSSIPSPTVLVGSESLKWSVADPAQAQSQTWVVKADSNRRGQDSVYIGTRQQMGAVKLSIHERWWGLSFNKEFAERRLPSGTQRTLSRFTPPDELVPGWKRAAIILIPSTSLCQPDSKPGVQAPADVLWWPAGNPAVDWQFHVLIGDSTSEPFTVTDAVGAVGIINFGAHRKVAVVAVTAELNAAELEMIAAQQAEIRESFSEASVVVGLGRGGRRRHASFAR